MFNPRLFHGLARSSSAATYDSTSKHLIIDNEPDDKTFTTDLVYEEVKNAGDEPSTVPPNRRFRRWEVFILSNPSVPAAFTLGILLCLCVISYATWLSREIMVCPTWTINCEVGRFVKWNLDNMAVTQGIATVFFSVGLAIIAHAAQCVSEASLWPLLEAQSFSLEGIDRYINIVRGSIMLIFHTADIALTTSSRFILIVTSLLVLTPLSAPPLVGLVYSTSDVPWTFQSNYVRGGGAARMFVQDFPPVSLGSESMSSYIAWARALSHEPLPESRNYMVDRKPLSRIGNATVDAVYTQLDVNCSGFPLEEVGTIKNGFAYFKTKMAEHNPDGRPWNSSDRVKIHLTNGLAVWADDYTFHSRNKSSVQMVFAAINGTIENGVTTNLSLPRSTPNRLSISAVVCDVAVEFMDRTLKIGRGGPPLPKDYQPTTISSIDTIHIEFANSTDQKSPLNTLNENALWFAAAPIIVCPSVQGAQPMYTREENMDKTSRLPVPYTNGPWKTTAPEHQALYHNWTIEDIRHFVNVSVGAVSDACSRNFRSAQPIRNATVYSLQYTSKLDPWRVVYLIVPFSIMVLGTIALFIVSLYLYKREGVPYMRLAPITEVVSHHHRATGISTPLERHGTPEMTEVPKTTTMATSMLAPPGRRQHRYTILGRDNQVVR